jgi:16S rRNA (cytosine1402-N4)-methyltransferase
VSSGRHIPVMAEAVLEWLAVREDGFYVDCTAGAGGHAALIAQRLRGGGLLALDRDPEAVERVRKRLAPFPFTAVAHANYGRLAAVLKEQNRPAPDGILLDAGLSSLQLDAADRGFTFQKEGPLDMRMDQSEAGTALDYLRGIREEELAEILKRYGDIRPARRIARGIRRRIDAGALATTGDLAAAVAEALDFVQGSPEELRTVFQAVRMAVNREPDWLESGLHQAVDVLAPGGRLAVIAFHSGEDRIVKQVLRAASRPFRERGPDGRDRRVWPPQLKVLTPRPLRPDAEETAHNPRAASARLRVAEKLPEREG